MDAVAPGIWVRPVRTPTLPPATHTNLFVLGTRQAVLVEPATPYDDELDAVIAELAELEAEQELELVAILATHHHVDHVGGARALSRALSLPIWCHAETASRLPAGVSASRLLDDDERIELGGTTALSVRCVHTPGHAPGHLAFLEEASSTLLAGDMVASVGTILVEPIDGDMALYLRSLDRLASLDAARLVPAHGGVVDEPRALLERYVAHRLAREARVLAALVAHGAPARPSELVPVAYADAPRSVWGLAALSTEAHLVKLERERRVSRAGAVWRAV